MNLIHSTSKKTAAVFSYIFLGLNSVSSILLTPLLLKYLGVEEYGLYQMVYSVGHYILILDLGISTVMVRYISEYRARGDYEGMRKFAGMLAILTMAICVVVFVAGIAVNLNLENIFTKLSTEDYNKSHWMFNLMVYQFVITIIDHYIHGAISAHERFVYTKLLGIVKIIIVFGLTVAFVSLGFGSVGIVMANAVVITLVMLCNAYYAFKVLNFKISFGRWNKTIMIPVFGLMLAMLLQSVVGNVNSSVDKTILGIMCTKTDVAVYSIAASIITLFNTVPTVISGLFQPQVTKMVVKGTDATQLTNLVIRVGRWQFILCGAFLAGLALFGMDFLQLWVGNRLTTDNMRFALLIMVIILPFNMVPLIQTVCISILNAYDKRLYRSLILAGMCVFHILFTIVIVKYWGPIGSPIGTALSYFIGYVLILNIYYSKALGLQVIKMFREIVSRSWQCLLLTIALCSPFLLWHNTTWIGFGVKVSAFCIVFFLSLYIWGFNAEEKNIVNQAIKKRK